MTDAERHGCMLTRFPINVHLKIFLLLYQLFVKNIKNNNTRSYGTMIEKSIEFLNSFRIILYNMVNLPVFAGQLLS